jgi:hypothetical protein
MSKSLYDNLFNGTEHYDMPSFNINRRETDKFVTYDSRRMRLDRIAGDLYGDETMTRLILWGNPEIEYEFDIPHGTVIRVPYPLNDVIQEVAQKIKSGKTR